MKATVITINDPNNYGNRLQNYALTRLLERYAREVGTAYYYSSSSLTSGRAKACIERHANPLRMALRGVRESGYPGLARAISFDRFTRRWCPETVNMYAGEKVEDDRVVYVLGSDQVWNYTFGLSREDLEARLGMLVPGERTISYAASIGLDNVGDEWRDTFREGWSRLSEISVREDRAAEIVREISGRESTVVLDPTLMLVPDEWAEVFTDFVLKGERYVLTYFLGKPTAAQRAFVRDFAQRFGLHVRALNDFSDRRTLAAGPAEFVELVSKAETVFTDSYHACCFSILFNRPFKVFNRVGFEGETSMNSRMRTLFRLFELEDLMGDILAMPEFDWGQINGFLELHRAESRAWLESALAEVAPE